MSGIVLALSVFLASVVEGVEALTVVLAVGTSRHWRSALQGVIAGMLLLAVVVAALGPSLFLIPIGVLRSLVGGLLLIFGLQWLRKAVLRAAGYKALHDETAIFEREVAAARAAEGRGRFAIGDWYGFTLSFKAVVLEGLEVAFIVIAFGSNQGNLAIAAAAAGAAVVAVVLAGFAVRAPLARVPENTIKFVVGAMLTTYGCFWGAEGAGARWPGGDAALLVLLPVILAVAFAVVLVLRSTVPSQPPAVPES